MIIDISLHVLLLTCDVLLQAANTFCVSVLYVHVVFDDKHVICVRASVLTADLSNLYMYVCMYIYIYILNARYRLVSRSTGVHFNMVCMNVHVFNVL